ncbi:MAG: GHKL domain-containing protein [Pseudobutyrivibrio sp.]|nr:GHKL domain-containing protein [Pseudobutyrivibrio sp.]
MTEDAFQLAQHIYELALILIYMGILAGLFFIFIPENLINRRRLWIFYVTVTIERLVISFIPYDSRGLFFIISFITLFVFLWKDNKEVIPLLSYVLFLWQSIFSICFIMTDMLFDSIFSRLIENLNYSSEDVMLNMYVLLTKELIFMFAIYLIIVSLELVAIRFIVKEKYIMTIKQATFMSAYALVSLLLMYMLVELSVVPVGSEVFVLMDQDISLKIKLPVVAFLLFLGQLGGLILWQEFQALREKDIENQNIIYKQRYTKKYINDLEKYNENIRLLKHDMAGKLTTLRGLIEAGTKDDALEYLNEMGIELNGEKRYSTGNPIIDIIINEKANAAKMSNIEFACNIVIGNHKILPAYEIGIIISNLLDNAIFATAKEKDGDRRIYIQGFMKEDFFIIEVKNTFTQEIKHWKEGIPLSNKGDNHGLGLKSVKRIAEKYLGTVLFDIQNGWFDARVMLQLNDQL